MKKFKGSSLIIFLFLSFVLSAQTKQIEAIKKESSITKVFLL